MLALLIKGCNLPGTHQLIQLPLEENEYCKQTNCKCSENNNVSKSGLLVFIKAVSVFIRNPYQLTTIVFRIQQASIKFSAQMQ